MQVFFWSDQSIYRIKMQWRFFVFKKQASFQTTRVFFREPGQSLLYLCPEFNFMARRRLLS